MADELSLVAYDFELPEEQIAAWPAGTRGDDRLLVLDRTKDALEHRKFAELGAFLKAGDLLVFNDVRVRRARLVATKVPGGGHVEILLLSARTEDGRTWECLLHSARAVKPGLVLSVAGGPTGRVVAREEERSIIEFEEALDDALLEKIGDIPLPPYIMRQREGTTATDSERYQTVYAERTAAVAAPTAGLHFTGAQLAELKAAGIEEAFITLEVGWGTFAPVRVDNLRDHKMHSEKFEISEAAADAINAAKRAGRRVIAVGTTAIRALESSANPDGTVRPGARATDIFITPGYTFRVIDGMVTNFHTPRSTLLVLVSAFAGRDRILAAYAEAVKNGYRFFSYGDAMLIV